MCSLLSNATADEQFAKLVRSGEPNPERNLVNLAGDDSVEKSEGLGRYLYPVKQWSQLNISKVQKYRKGRHRYYILGHHSECQYKVIYMLVFKSDADDTPEKKNYQNMILKALGDENFRKLELPQLADQQENS